MAQSGAQTPSSKVHSYLAWDNQVWCSPYLSPLGNMYTPLSIVAPKIEKSKTMAILKIWNISKLLKRNCNKLKEYEPWTGDNIRLLIKDINEAISLR